MTPIQLEGTDERTDEQLSNIFAALSNSTRRAILAQLANGEATVKQLAAPFDMSLPAVSKHIKVLERAGLVRQGRDAQYRPCTIDTAPLQAVADWADQYRHIWETSMNRMDAYLETLEPAAGRKVADKETPQ